MSKKIIFILLCGVGAGMIGYFANKINTTLGAALFTIGVIILTFSTIMAAKSK